MGPNQKLNRIKSITNGFLIKWLGAHPRNIPEGLQFVIQDDYQQGLTKLLFQVVAANELKFYMLHDGYLAHVSRAVVSVLNTSK